MSTEQSTLLIAVDSTSVPKATTELDKLTAASARAEAATGKLAQSSRTAGTAQAAAAGDVTRAEQAASKYAETEAQAAARIHDMVQASLAARDAVSAQATAQQVASTKIAEGNAAQLAASKDLAAAQTRQMAAWTAMRAPVVEVEGILAKSKLTAAEVAKAEALLDKAQADGVISAGELAAAFKALDEAKIKDIAITEAQNAANKQALNSKTQYEIGVLGGEIATGNVSRVKRSVPALLNATGLTTKLLSPVGLGITAVVASLALFGKAVVDREQDLLAFNKALASTGDFAGTSAAQLQGIAAMVGDSTHDYGNATKAVLALAQAGFGASPALEGMAETAVRFGKATGDMKAGIEFATVAMGGSAKQIEDLDQKYNLLTASQANEVQYLFQIGEADKARQIVMRDGSAALAKRAQEVEDSTGSIIKAWNAVTSAVSSAWHEMEHAGATDVASRLKAVNDQLAQAQGVHMNASQQFVPNASPGQIGNLKALQGQLQAQLIQQGWDRTNQALDDARNKAAKGAQEWAAAALSPIDQLQSKLDVAVKMKDAFFAVPRTAEESARFMRSYNQQIALAAQGYESGLRKVNPTSRQKADPLAGLSNMVAGLTTKSLQVPGDTALTAYVQGVAKLIDEYNKAISKGGDVTRATANYDQGIKALTASLDNAKTAQENAIKAYNDSVDAEIRARQQQIDLQIASVGLSQREIQQLQAKAQIQEEVARKIEQLNRQRSQPGANVGFIEAEIAKQQASLPVLLKQQDDLYSKMNALRSDWMTGLETSWNEYIDQGKDVAGMTANVFNDAFSGMENSMVNFVQTGKLNFKDLADSIISDLVRMETRILISQALTTIFGSVSGTSIASNYMANGGSTYAAGGVPWGVNLSGGRAGGGPVAGGSLYEVAEGGKPEVLSSGGHTYLLMGTQDGYVTPASTSGTSPLGRTGSAGVAQTKGGDVIVNVQNNGGQPAQVSQSKDGKGNDIITVMINAAANEVDSRIMRGGSTYKAIQQTYGLNRRGVPVAG